VARQQQQQQQDLLFGATQQLTQPAQHAQGSPGGAPAHLRGLFVKQEQGAPASTQQPSAGKAAGKAAAASCFIDLTGTSDEDDAAAVAAVPPPFLSCPYGGESAAAQVARVRADIAALEAQLEQV
jgi:hypothetical protein